MWGLSVRIHRGDCPISTRGDVISTPFSIGNKNGRTPPRPPPPLGRDRKQTTELYTTPSNSRPIFRSLLQLCISPSPTLSKNSDSQDLIHGDKTIPCLAVTSISLGALFRDTAGTSSSSVAGDLGLGFGGRRKE